MAGIKKFIAAFVTVTLAISVTGLAFASDELLQKQGPDTDAEESVDVYQDTQHKSTEPEMPSSEDASVEVLDDGSSSYNTSFPLSASEPAAQNETADEYNLMADQAAGEVAIRGIVWNDKNRDGYKDPDESGINGVEVRLYNGPMFSPDWGVVARAMTGSDGSYVFIDDEGDEVFFAEGEAYYVEFVNNEPSTTQFSQGYPESSDPSVSHIASGVDGDVALGISERFLGMDIASDGTCIINAGICALPTVTYLAGADDPSISGIPIPSVESVRSGTQYFTASPGPTREGYTFVGWIVTQGAAADNDKSLHTTPSIGNEYAAGDWFYMPLADVELTAQWAKQAMPRLEGYKGVYDGAEHGVKVVNDAGEPWKVEGDTISYFIDESGSQKVCENAFTDVVDVEVTVVVERSDGNNGSEVILQDAARVTIDPLPVKIGTKSNARVYDGTPLTGALEVQVGDASPNEFFGQVNTVPLLWNDYAHETGTVVVTGSQLNAGSSVNAFSQVVFNGDSGAKASNYKVTYAAPGILTVEQKGLIVRINSASKVYDGTPLLHTSGVIEGVIIPEASAVKLIVSGSQTDVGASKMSYSIEWNGVNKNNYKISEEHIGTLVVKQSETEVSVITNGTYTYDGRVHDAQVEVLFGSNAGANVLPKGYKLVEARSSTQATDVTNPPLPATCDTLVIVDARGVDVTEALNIRYYDGTLTINPATLRVTTQSASKVYDGTPLTAGGSISGFVQGETASFAVTGSQTEVGSSINTYTLTWTDAKTKGSNYGVSENLGTLQVNGAPGAAGVSSGSSGNTVRASSSTSETGNALIDTMANVAGAITGRDVTVTISPEQRINENETPTAAKALYEWDWVALYSGAGVVITAVYMLGVVIHRRRHMSSLDSYENTIFGLEEPIVAGRPETMTQ